MRSRIDRVNQLIKETIANILEKDISFGNNVLVTVQNVNTSKDLKYSHIGITIMPSNKSEEVLKILKNKLSYIQKELAKKIEIKFVPKIKFQIDRGEEKASRIEEILKKIK